MSLAEEYIGFLDLAPLMGNYEPTWDDFYDYVGVPSSGRSDFASTAIIRQVQEILRK